MIPKPDPSEYDPFYETYVSKTPDGDLVALFRSSVQDTLSLLDGLPEGAGESTYAPGKWSIREVVGHVIDTERLFAFRALHMARGDAAALPGMDQEQWSAVSNAGSRSISELTAELKVVRQATIDLFSSLDAEALSRRGTASDCEFTVRAIGYIILGHETHHRGVLADRYLDRSDTES